MDAAFHVDRQYRSVEIKKQTIATTMNDERQRIASIDVLRGLNMFLLVGLGPVVWQIYQVYPYGIAVVLNSQMTHYEGFGLHLFDMIFPTFLFLAGCSWPFSLSSQLAKGVTKRALLLKIVRRFLLLALLGAVLFGLPSFDILHVRVNSILGRIGFGWAVVAITTVLMPKRWWWVAFGLFVAYWLSFFVCGWIVLPKGGDPWAWGNGTNIIEIFDTWIGKPNPDQYGNEGFYHDIGCICSAFVGYWAGLTLKRRDETSLRKAVKFLVGGGLLIVLGVMAWTYGLCPPSIAQWNPTFILVSGGLDLVALGVLFLVVDVLRWQDWTKFFVVMGANALFIYVIGYFVSFEFCAHKFLCGIERVFLPAEMAPIVDCAGDFLIKWLILLFMYQKRLFVRL